jgi:glycosyltransferase involved in cell wall biosynthesis
MRIGFDAKRAFHNATGLGNYSRDVLRLLHRAAPQLDLYAYSPSPGRVPFEGPADRFHLRLPTSPFARAFPALWRQRAIVRDLRRDRIDLFHGLAAELPSGIEQSGVRTIVTVHDLIYERFPALYARVDRAIYRQKCRSAVRRADLVIAISERTRRDLVELYGAPEEKIRVVYQGCHRAFDREPAAGVEEAALRRHGLAAPFLLSVGTVEARKNLALTVRALAGLPDVHLAVVGRETPYALEVRAIVAASGLGPRVHFLSGVTTDELAALYRRALALVYPSRYEGFGIPIVEALFSGTPVVTTRASPFDEAGGPGSAYVDPDEPDELRTVLAAIVADPARRQAMREAGLGHAQRFRDEAIAGTLLAAYDEALRVGARGPRR